MTIKCGDDGSSSNNCTFVGGGLHFLAPSNEQLTGLGLGFIFPDVSGLVLRGIKSVGVQGPSFQINAPGTDITIEDCHFHENVCHNVIGFSDSNFGVVRNCIFEVRPDSQL
jgi:hypothetical protein